MWIKTQNYLSFWYKSDLERVFPYKQEKLGFTPHKAEKPLWGVQLQEKEEDKDKKST